MAGGPETFLAFEELTAVLFGLAIFGNRVIFQFIEKMEDISSNFVFAAVPLFVFMGAMLEKSGIAGADLRYVAHATTVATNAIIEGNVARTGFVTTDGFRDLLEIQRQVRSALYDVHFEKPRPLVPRHRCFGVRERLEPDGTVARPLDEEKTRRLRE